MRLGDCLHKEYTLCIVPGYHRLETIRLWIGLVWIGGLKRWEGGGGGGGGEWVLIAINKVQYILPHALMYKLREGLEHSCPSHHNDKYCSQPVTTQYMYMYLPS